jgi:Putative inner membrane protein (DUF1819)
LSLPCDKGQDFTNFAFLSVIPMQTSTSSYSFSLTKGALFFQEACLVFQHYDAAAIFDTKSKMTFDFLPQNSETSRRSIGQEIVKRVRSSEWPEIWTHYNDIQEKDQRLLLFYAICCHYAFIQDFMIEVYHKKWLNMDVDISKEDIAYFLDLKAAYHPEISDVQDYTKQKIVQVTYRCLQEANLVLDGKMIDPIFSDHLISLFRYNGHVWFLEIIHQNNL